MKRIQSLAILAFGLFLVSCGDDDTNADLPTFGTITIGEKEFTPEHHLFIQTYNEQFDVTKYEFTLSTDSLRVSNTGTISFSLTSDLLRLILESPDDQFQPGVYTFDPFDESLLDKITSIQFFENGFDNLTSGPTIGGSVSITQNGSKYAIEFDSLEMINGSKIHGTLEGVFDNINIID